MHTDISSVTEKTEWPSNEREPSLTPFLKKGIQMRHLLSSTPVVQLSFMPTILVQKSVLL